MLESVLGSVNRNRVFRCFLRQTFNFLQCVVMVGRQWRRKKWEVKLKSINFIFSGALTNVGSLLIWNPTKMLSFDFSTSTSCFAAPPLVFVNMPYDIISVKLVRLFVWFLGSRAPFVFSPPNNKVRKLWKVSNHYLSILHIAFANEILIVSSTVHMCGEIVVVLSFLQPHELPNDDDGRLSLIEKNS